MRLLDLALMYLKDEGLSIIPLKPGDKAPAVEKLPNGKWGRYSKDPPTEDEVRAWFSGGDVGIGVVCGQVSGGLVVIDFDGPGFAEVSAEFEEVFHNIVYRTRRVKTGSGKLHIWFRYREMKEDFTRVKWVFPDIDRDSRIGAQVTAVEMRANGHYVAAPPSLHPSGGRYEFLNDKGILEIDSSMLEAMMAWLDQKGVRQGSVRRRQRREDRVVVEVSDDRIRRAAEYYLDRAISEAKVGDRNNIGFWLAQQLRDLRLSFAEAESYMREYASRVPQEGDGARAAPYTEKEALASLESAYKREPREPAIPGVSRITRYTPSGREVKLVDISPEMVDILVRHPGGEDGNGRTFVDLFGDKFCYVKERGSWFKFDGVRWVEADEEAYLAMVEVLELRLRAAMALDDDDPIKEKLVKTLLSERKRKVHADRSLDAAATRLVRHYTDFDSDPYLLCCSNGVVDLRDGEFRLAKPEDMLHRSTRVRYDPTARCPRWDRFLREVFLGNEDLVDFIQRAVGYSLTGLMPDYLFICYGTGSNGKSIFLSVLERLLGEYSVVAPPTAFMWERDVNRGAPSPDLASLAGARLAKCIEVRENIRLNEERVKALTGGDRIRARFLFQNPFEFYPTAKVWWAVNHKPIIRDTTHAMWRRIRLIPFEARFEPGDGVWQPKEVLMSELESELSGILNWAIEGCLRWKDEGLALEGKVKAATEEYRVESDVVERFLSEMVVRDKWGQVKASKLYQEYKSWAEKNGEPSISARSFGERILEKGISRVHTREGNFYTGIRLASDEVML